MTTRFRGPCQRWHDIGTILSSPLWVEQYPHFSLHVLHSDAFSFSLRHAAYQNNRLDDEARKHHAERIVATYISPTASGVPASLIYTSEAQRKALAAKMKRLWRKDKAKHKGGSSNDDTSNSNNLKERDGQPAGPPSEGLQWGTTLDEGGDVVIAGRQNPPQDDGRVSSGCGGGGGGGGKGGSSVLEGGGDGGDGGRVGFDAAPGTISDDNAPGSGRSQQQISQQEPSSSFARWDSAGGGSGGSDSDGEMMDGIAEEEGRQSVDRRTLLRSLFDEILDQNAIPTIRQNSEFN